MAQPRKRLTDDSGRPTFVGTLVFIVAVYAIAALILFGPEVF